MILPDKPAKSLLLRAAAHQDADLEMPPPENKVAAAALKSEELGLIELWIEQGAKGEVHGPGPIAWKPLPPALNTIFAVALTPDGQFAACGRGNRVFIYQIPTGQLAAQLADPQLRNGQSPRVAHRDTVNSLAFSRDGELLASGGYRELKIWRRVKPSQIFKSTQAAEILASTPSQDGQWLASVDKDGDLMCWPVNSDPPTLLAENQSTNAILRFSPNSTRLVVASASQLSVLKTSEGALEFETRGLSNVTAVAWTTDTSLAVADSSGSVRVFSIEARRGLSVVGKELKSRAAVALLETAGTSTNRLLTGGSDGLVKLWDLKSGKVVFETKLGSAPTSVALRPDGKVIATTSGNSVKLWKVSDAKLIAEIKGDRHLADAVAAGERELVFAKSELEYRKSVLKSFETNHTEIVARQKKAMETNAAILKVLIEKQTVLTNALALESEAAKALDNMRSGVRTAVEAYLTAAEGEQSPTNLLAEAKTALEKFPEDTKEKRKAAAKKLAETKKKVEEAEKALKPVAISKSTADHELELASAALQKSNESAPVVKQDVENAETELTRAEAALKTSKRLAAAAEQPVQALAFSSDNSLLLTASTDGALRSWSADTGAPCETFGDVSGVKSLTLSGQAKVLVGTSSGVGQWNLESKWVLDLVIGTGGGNSALADRVNALEFTPDGKSLLSGGGEPSRDGEIKVWDVETGRLLHEFKNVHSDSVFALDLSPDGKFLASAGADRFARVTDFATGKILKNLEGHANHVLGVSWKHDGRTLLTAGADNVAKTWDFSSGERRKNIEGFSKEVTSVSFIGFGGTAVLTSGDGQAVIVNDEGRKLRSLPGTSDYLYSGAASIDGRTVVAGGSDGSLRVWDAEGGKLLKQFPAPAN